MMRTATTLPGLIPTNPIRAMIARVGFCFDRAKPDRAANAWQFSGSPAKAIAAQIVADETPRRRFVKDLIRAGRYVAHGNEVQLSVADLDELAEQTNAFIAAGNDVPVPDGHTTEATANRGYTREVFRDGDTLYGVIEMIGEDGIKTAARSKVSINSDVNYTDGKGKTYSHVITHVALTNEPVVPDQNGFVPLAASRGGKSNRALVLSLAPQPENTNMEALTKIAAMLGVEGIESLDEAAMLAAIAKAIEGMKGMSKTATEEAATVKAELTGLKASLAKGKPEPDAMLVKLAAKNRTLELDSLVTGGHITPAVKDKLADVWIGKDNAGLKLSLDSEGDGRFSAMVDALKQNDPVKLGEQTKGQGMALSRAPAADDGKADSELLARMAKHMGIPVKSK